jgi:hypothetical protein
MPTIVSAASIKEIDGRSERPSKNEARGQKWRGEQKTFSEERSHGRATT